MMGDNKRRRFGNDNYDASDEVVADEVVADDYSLGDIMEDMRKFVEKTKNFPVEVNCTFFTTINNKMSKRTRCINLGTTNENFGKLPKLPQDGMNSNKMSNINIDTYIKELIGLNKETLISKSGAYNMWISTTQARGPKPQFSTEIKNVYLVAVPDLPDSNFNPCTNLKEYFPINILNINENTTLLNQDVPLYEYVFMITKNVEKKLNELKRTTGDSEFAKNLRSFFHNVKPVLQMNRDELPGYLSPIQFNVLVELYIMKRGGIRGGKTITKKKKVKFLKKRKTKVLKKRKTKKRIMK